MIGARSSNSGQDAVEIPRIDLESHKIDLGTVLEEEGR